MYEITVIGLALWKNARSAAGKRARAGCGRRAVCLGEPAGRAGAPATLGRAARRNRAPRPARARAGPAHHGRAWRSRCPAGPGASWRARSTTCCTSAGFSSLRDALPTPLAALPLLGGDLLTAGQARQVAVLLVSAPVRGPAWEQGVRPAAAAAWHRAGKRGCRRRPALRGAAAALRRCGDAGVWRLRRPGRAGSAARRACGRRRAEQGWRRRRAALAPLSLALASGYALATALPGLGLCVVGAPVEQAVGLQQLALRARRLG